MHYAASKTDQPTTAEVNIDNSNFVFSNVDEDAYDNDDGKIKQKQRTTSPTFNPTDPSTTFHPSFSPTTTTTTTGDDDDDDDDDDEPTDSAAMDIPTFSPTTADLPTFFRK